MKYIQYIIICSLLYSGNFLNAQKVNLKRADKDFSNLAYIDAVKIYDDVASSGHENADLFQKLGDAYYFNANYTEAVKWYEKLYDTYGNLTSEYSFRYGQSLKAIGKYTKADDFLKDFFRSQGQDFQGSGAYLTEIENGSYQYKTQSFGFNTPYSDYPAYLREDSLFVISAGTGKINPWNNEPASDVFMLDGTGLNELSGNVNTKFNEGSLVLTKDGNTLYFTRNDYNNNKRGQDNNKTTRLKMYRAQKIDGKWKNIEELPFSNSSYSIGHPALSKDESKLYFVSDLPNNGSKGGTDIYEIEIFADGGFGAPFNMSGLNTPGNEMFPFIAEDGSFYFSSNGHMHNLGGLDVYRSRPNQDGVYGKVVNIGKPINSPMDDFAFVLNSDKKKGYFASNRSGARSDDIFSFDENEGYEPPCERTYQGVVRDKKTGDILENVLVSLIDEDNKVITKEVVVAGLYQFDERDCNDAKFVRAEKNGFLTGEELVNTAVGAVATTNVLLDRRKIALTQGTNLGLLINPIFFDLDRFNIRPDAVLELQKIVSIMKSNPTIKVDVRSHTDSRAPDEYNLSLSNRRVQSTINYLTRNGIDPSRLTGRGYGESQLLNGCANGIDCSQKEHQRNRRSEFIIIK